MEENWNYSQSSMPLSVEAHYGNSTYSSMQYQSWNQHQPPVVVPPYPPPTHTPVIAQTFTQPPPPTNQFPQNYQTYDNYSTNYQTATNSNFQDSYYSNSYQNSESYSSYNYPPPNYGYDNFAEYSNYQQSHTQGYDIPNTYSRNSSTVYNFKDELESYKLMQNNSHKRLERDSEQYDYKRKIDVRKRNYSPERRSKRYSRSPSPSTRKYSRIRDLHSREHSSSSSSRAVLEKDKSERDIILTKWRKNYCATREEVCNKIKELSKVNQEEILEKEKHIWTRTTPADLYYEKDENNSKVTRASEKLLKICDAFKETLVMRADKINETKPKYEPPPRKNRARLCKHKSKYIICFFIGLDQ